MKKTLPVLIVTAFLLMLYPTDLFAMHIAEGFLPGKWSIIWSVVALPFIIISGVSIKKAMAERPKLKIILAMAGAFAFVLSSLKLPSVAGSSSHATGIGLGAILFGPWPMVIIALIVLLFQALLLAHGGLTTLGANLFSMGIAGPFVAYFIYRGLKAMKASNSVAVFFGAALGDLFTYVVTSIQLGLAFPAEAGLMFSIMKFMGIFAVTQIPLAIVEGLLTVVVFNIVLKNAPDEMASLNFEMGKTVSGKRTLVMNIVAVMICVALIFVPFLAYQGEYSGTDDQGMDAITEIDENYEPWFNSIFEPGSDQMEVTLFSLQTAIGAGLLGYFIGNMKKKAKKKNEHTSS